MIVDDIDKFNSPNRFISLSKKLKTKFVTTSKKKIFLDFYYSSYLRTSAKINFISKLNKLIKIFFVTFYFSLKTKCNLLPIIITILKILVKYETLFGEIKAKFLIQERHYNTSYLKNYIFKRYGGLKVCVAQKNILQMNGVGMYIFCDIFFSLGTKTGESIKNYGGEVKKIIPVGSLAMEFNYYNRKSLNSLKKLDILVFASDHNKIFHSGYNSYYEEYIAHYDWILKFAIMYPDYNIGIKLKKQITDMNVFYKFKKVGNVKFFFDKSDLSDSYYYAENAKALITWSSTLAYEFIGAGRVVYFLDPEFKNISFLSNINYIKKFKIGSFNKFHDNMLEQINFKKKRYIMNKKTREKFCLSSKNTTNKIYTSLKLFA